MAARDKWLKCAELRQVLLRICTHSYATQLLVLVNVESMIGGSRGNCLRRVLSRPDHVLRRWVVCPGQHDRVITDINCTACNLLVNRRLAIHVRGNKGDRKSTRLNSSHVSDLVCRLLLEKK